MAGNHFTVTFDAQMNVSQIKGAINDMKKGLEQLKLPPDLEKKVGKTFTDMASELRKFEDLTSKDIKSMGDFKAIEKSGSKIIDLYGRLKRDISSLSNLSSKDMAKFFPKEITDNIKKATDALDAYNKKQAEINKQSKSLKSQRTKKENKRNELTEEIDNLKIANDKQEEQLARKKSLEKEWAALDKEITARENKNVIGTSSKKLNSNYKDIGTEQLKKSALEAKAEIDKLGASLKNVISKTDYDKKQAGLTELKEQIENIDKAIQQLESDSNINLDNFYNALKDVEGVDIEKVPKTVEGLKQAVAGLNAKGLEQFNSNLKQMGTNVDSQESAFENLQQNIRETGYAVEDADAKFRDVSAFKSRISMFLSYGTAARTLQRAIKSSFETIKELDATMTETAVVTDFSVADMWKQMPKYTKMANELGVTTNDAYKAATLYYQQGLNTNQVMAVSNETLKMARIAGIDAADATDYMTAALRGFNMEINEASAQRVNDVYSKLAAETASDTEELSIAMSKTASIANSANMEFENTAALLAQIIETTREAPETAGTAMKTIIARFSEVKSLFSQGQLLGTDEEGEEININKIDTALKNVGISLKDFLSGEIGLDQVLLQLASKWDTLDLATQRYIATTAAGSRQQSRFLAMMSNYSRTVELTGKAYNATGAGQEQFEKTLDSMETALNRLKNAWDQFAMGIANSSFLKGGVNTLTGLLGAVNQLTDGLSGTAKSIVSLGLAFGGFQLGRGAFDILTTLGRGNVGLDTLKTGAGKTLYTFRGLVKTFKNERKIAEAEAGRAGFISPLVRSFIGDEKRNEKVIAAAIKKQRPHLRKELLNNLTEQGLEAYRQKGKKGLEKFGEDFNVKGLSDLYLEDGNKENNIDTIAAKAQILGVAASVAGVGVLKLSDALEKAGHTNAAKAFDVLGTSLLGLGTTLTMFGTLLPTLIKAFPQLEGAITSVGSSLTSVVGKIKGLGIGGMLPILAAVAAAIIAITMAINAMKAEKALSLEGQLESTEKAIQRAKEEAQQAKDAYDHLLETKNKYNDTQKAMEGLAKGTQSWSEALVEANSQVTQLIDKTPGLAEYLEVGSQGQLSISNEGWSYLEDYSKKGVRNSQYALLSHELKRADLTERKELRDFAKENLNWREGNADKTWGSGLVSAYTPGGEKYYDIFGGENFAKIFAGTREAPTEEMKSAAKRLGMTVDEVYDNQVQFAKLNSDLIGYHSTQLGLAKSLLSSSASEEALNYKYSDQLFSGLAEHMTDFEYTNNINDAANKIANVNSEQFQQLAEEYGVAYKMGVGSQQDLETLYAAMKNIDVETVSEAKLSETELSKEIATMASGAVTTDALDSLTTALRSLGEDSQQQLASLLSGNITDMTFDEIKNLDVSKLGKQLESALGPEADSIMKNLGFESMDSFINSWDQKAVAESYIKNIKGTLDKIRKYSKNTKDEDLFTDFEAQQNRFKDMGLQYQSMVNSIFTSLEDISDPAVISAGWDAFSNAINDASISAEQITEVQDWITGIDWSNPIEGAYALGEAANSSSKYIQEISNSMQEVGSSAFDASAQMKYFLQSDFESIKEDLSDIINAGEEITGADIRGLAKNYKNLDKMLQNTGMSATSLGKALTMLNKGELKDFQLTNAVLSAIGHAGEIDDITASVLDRISNFDPGYNEGDITGFVKSSNEAISELLSSGLGGSQQIGSYLDYWFGSDWDVGLNTADQYISKVNELNSILGKNATDMAPLWQNIMSGKDIFGNAIDTSVFDKYGFSFDNGELVLAPDASLEKMVQGLQEVGLTKNMAEAMLADEKARNPQLMLDLRNREFPSALTNLIEGGDLFQGLHGSILDQSEIDAVLDFYGKSIDDFNSYLESTGKKVHILDLYDENGNIKDVNDALNQIGEAFGYEDKSVSVFDNATKTWKKEGEDAGKQFSQGFIDENRKTGEKVLKLDDFNKTLKNLRIPDEAQEQLRKGFISSFENGAIDSIQYFSEATGRLEKVKIPADFDWNADDALEQLNNLFTENDKDLEIKIETDKLRQSIQGALEGLTIDFSINDGKITMSINSAIDAADTEVEPTIKKPDTSPITNALNKLKGTSIFVSISSNFNTLKNQFLSFVGRSYSVGVNAQVNYSTGRKPVQGGQSAQKKADKAHQQITDPTGTKKKYFNNLPTPSTNSTRAKGIKTAKSSHIALTGEEGPEMHLLAEGGYYVTGVGGPSLDSVGKGDTIYTAEETKKIMSGRRRSITRYNFMPGQNNTSGGVSEDGTSRTKIGNRTGSSSGSSGSSSSNKNSNATASKTTADNTKKAAEEAEKWENSFDHLYNLTQDINAELRTREKLEKQYNRYQKERIPLGKTLAQISKAELYNLEQQRKLQEKMFEARKKDITDTEEKYKDYVQYAHYNWQDQTIEIEWDKINAVTDEETGNKIEEYISKLEEIQDQIQEAEDALEDINDEVAEIRERGAKANQELQDMVLDKLIEREQQQIDLQEKTNQAINDAASDLHDAISHNIEKMRQDRDNERKKEDLAEKERRLAYLKMDTTGGNALAIKQLEKELKEEREEFNDALVDQALTNMQEQNEEAANQRERQVELLQGILDFQKTIGYFSQRALEIVEAGTKDGFLVENSDLYDLLITDNNDYWEKSVASRNAYLSEIATLVAEKYAKDELVNSERNLNNGGYMTQMMNATSAEQFRQAEEARNNYINEHPEEGWATTGFSDSYQLGQINKKGLTTEQILGTNTKGTKYDFQALINQAIKDQNWEEAAIWEGYRDLKLHMLNRDSERTYGSQAASAYAKATGSLTSSGERGTAKDQSASHSTSILEEKAKKLYETSMANLPEPTTDGGYMTLMQEAMDRGRFDEAFAYAKKRDAKIDTTGKAYNEQDSFKYVYRRFTGYGDNWEAARAEYKKGFGAGYKDGEDYKALTDSAISNSQWKKAFYYAGQRDKKLATDPSVAQYKGPRDDTTWEYVFRKWNGQFKTGGLVEGTGLAWLDGTPSRPEYVLNAGQTQAFLRLADMVSNLGSGLTQQTVGDTYINVDINVDQIANDYDVEVAANKVKQILYQDAMYRNVNRVNLLR